MKFIAIIFFTFLHIYSASFVFAKDEVAQLTATYGNIKYVKFGTSNDSLLKKFSKVSAGDVITLGDKASIRLVFFEGEREEIWQGPGTVPVKTHVV